MDDDSSGHDVFAQALSGGGDGQVAGTIDAQDIGTQDAPQTGQEPPQGGSEPDQGQSQPQGQPQPQQRDQNGDVIPSWRLREEAEGRRQEAEARRQAEGRLQEMVRWRQQREAEDQRRQEEEALRQQNLWEAQDPNAFIDQRVQFGARQALDPIQQQIALMHQQQVQISNHNARLVAGSVYGADKVAAAEQAVLEALQSGELTRQELDRLNASPNPYEAGVRWHQRHSTLRAIGGDLDGYNQRQQEAYLKDPAFLARAMEAHRQLATPVQTGVPGGRAAQPASRTMPSLNRATSAQDPGAEPEDPQEVFADALSAPRPRPR